MLKSKAIVLAKIETTYGVDASPTAAANAILCEEPEIEVLGKKLERNNTRSYLGALTPLNIGEGIKISFGTELKGSGTAGTAPEIGPLLRACGLTETVVASTSVTYDPHSDVLNGESVTLYFYRDAILHKVLGARGNVSLEAKAGEFAKLKFELTGLYAGPVDTTLPTGTFNAVLPPVFQNASFSLDGYSAVIENLSVNLGNEIAKRVDANAASGIKEYFIRARAVTGECDPEVVPLSTKDFWSAWSNSSRVALSATIGSAAGNICTITAPKVAFDVPKYADREDLLTYGLSLIFTPDTGNDEISIAFT